jgi:hypothetical protein
LDAMREAMGYVPPPPKTARERLEEAASNVRAYATETHGGRATALLVVTLSDVIDVLIQREIESEVPAVAIDAPDGVPVGA